MILKENKFKAGNHVHIEYSYDGGFGRTAIIYVITKVTEKSIIIMKVCEKHSSDCCDKELETWYTNEKPKTLKLKIVDENDFYDWKLGEQYTVIRYCDQPYRIWATEQFTDFSDIKDTGSYYKLK